MSFEVICAGAREHPTKTAVIYNGYSISYAALASAIATSIESIEVHSLPAGQTVVVRVHNLVDCWVIVFALQTLGLNTVCIHAIDALDTLRLQGVACILTIEREADHHNLEPRSDCGSRLITLSGPFYHEREISHRYAGEDRKNIGGHIQYTSGTTGELKQLLLPASLQQQRITERLKYRDRNSRIVCHCTHFGLWTAVGYRSPLTTWEWGGCVIFDQRPDWYRHFLQCEMTETVLVPQMIKELLEHIESTPPLPVAREFLLFVTGGFLAPELIEKIRAHISETLMNGYASSEINVPLLHSVITRAEDTQWLTYPGLREVEIVNEDGFICPAGVEGHLRVKLTDLDNREYLNDENASKAVFKGGYFYPGDMAIQRKDGRIQVLGRKSDVITMYGRKIPVAPLEEEIRNRLDADDICLFSGVNEAGEEEVIVTMESKIWPDSSRLDQVGVYLADKFKHIKFARVFPFPRSEAGTRKVDRRTLRKQVFQAKS